MESLQRVLRDELKFDDARVQQVLRLVEKLKDKPEPPPKRGRRQRFSGVVEKPMTVGSYERLVAGETQYLEKLKLVVEQRDAMRSQLKSWKKIIKPAQVDAIFGNIERIYCFHAAFLELLKKYAPAKAPLVRILANSATVMRIYMHYIMGWGNARFAMEQCKEHPEFVRWLEGHSELSLSALLTAPLNRISYYQHELEHLKTVHPGDQLLEPAIQRYKALKDFAGSARALTDLAKLQRSGELSNFKGELAVIYRELVATVPGRFRVNNEQAKDGRVYFFNDIIVAAQEARKGGFQVRGTLTLRSATLGVAGDNLLVSDSGATSFIMETHKVELEEALSAAREVLNARREAYLPRAMSLILDYLKSAATLKSMRRDDFLHDQAQTPIAFEMLLRLDRGDTVPLATLTPKLACFLLRRYLDELAEPLIPEELYSSAVEGTVDSEDLKRIPLLSAVLEFFALFCSICRTEPSAVATVVGPAILRPAGVLKKRELPFAEIQAGVSSLIQNYESIFSIAQASDSNSVGTQLARSVAKAYRNVNVFDASLHDSSIDSCAVCSKHLSPERALVVNKSTGYHAKCLSCFYCGADVSKGFMVLRGDPESRPCCVSDYYALDGVRCFACFASIRTESDLLLLVDELGTERTYHQSCLKCASCRAGFVSNVGNMDFIHGEPCCSACSSNSELSGSSTTRKKITAKLRGKKKKSSAPLEAALLKPANQALLLLFDRLVSGPEVDSVAGALLGVFQFHDVPMVLIRFFINLEIDRCKEASTLFRGNSLSTKIIRIFSGTAGQRFLRSALHQPLLEVPEEDLEIDPKRVKLEEEELKRRQSFLKTLIMSFLASIVTAEDAVPHTFFEICSSIYVGTIQKFHDSGLSSVGGFIFLRFLSPAIVSPASFGLVEEGTISKHQRRSLMVVGKVLQAMSNGVEFHQKEAYMEFANPLMAKFRGRLNLFLQNLTVVPPKPPSAPVLPGKEAQKAVKADLALLTDFMRNHKGALVENIPTGEDQLLDELEEIVGSAISIV